MSGERALRAARAARACGADWAVLTSVEAVCACTGHVAAIEAGPSPFNGGPTTAVVAADGSFALLVNELERRAAEATGARTVRSYESIGLEDPRPLAEKYRAEARSLFGELGVGGTVAVEAATCPRVVAELLPDARLVQIDHELDRARAVKTADEIQLLRECARITAVGHAAALTAAQTGRRELEIFAEIRCAMEVAAGERLPLTGDLLTGITRTAGVMGWPTARVVAEGDPVICDLAPRVGGYWGDSCNTFVLGEPTSEFIRLYEAAARALEVARETLRPGITAGDFDRAVRGVLQREGLRNPLHIGHGVGAGSHEWPRLIPRNEAVLEAGMVLMCEPGAYDPKIGGVRLEWMFLVTDSGNEVLSPFEHVLTPGTQGVSMDAT